MRIPGREVVREDVLLLAEGDRIPADGVVLQAHELAIDESMLTGESEPVPKQVPQDRVFAGTMVVRGQGVMRVDAVGHQTELGRIGRSLQTIALQASPLHDEVSRLTRRLLIVAVSLCLALMLLFWALRGDWLHGMLAGITLAMAILPEELPVVLTIFLGLGAWRLAREKVLTRSMPAVELLGATTVLCVDKTGTLTMNRMALRRLWVDGASHQLGAEPGQPLPEAFHGTLEYAVLASHRRAFDPMEAAIAQAGQSQLAGTEHLHADWQLVEDYPLSRELLAMSRVWQSPDHQHLLVAAKGAPEAIVDLCHLDADRRDAIARQVEALAGEGLRVLAVARAVFRSRQLPEIQHDFDFEFVGLIALEDPVRPDVPAAIAECRAAGIRVVMITGDHPQTPSPSRVRPGSGRGVFLRPRDGSLDAALA